MNKVDEDTPEHVITMYYPIDSISPIIKCSCGIRFEWTAEANSHLKNHSEAWKELIKEINKNDNNDIRKKIKR